MLIPTRPLLRQILGKVLRKSLASRSPCEWRDWRRYECRNDEHLRSWDVYGDQNVSIPRRQLGVFDRLRLEDGFQCCC